MSREAIEKGINVALVIGFLIFALGIAAWVFSLSQSFRASPEAMLVILGCIVLILGTLAAKVFSKIGN